MTHTDLSADYARRSSGRMTSRREAVRARYQTFALTPDMINGLIVIGGSLVMALAGMGLGAWMQLPFGN